MTPIHVVSCIDENFAPMLEVLVHSVALSNPLHRPIVYHVAYIGETCDSSARLAHYAHRAVSVQLFAAEDRYSAIPLDLRSSATFARLDLARMLPELDRVLYHDADMLCRTVLGPLFDLDLEGHAIGAVRDPAMWLNANKGKGYDSARGWIPWADYPAAILGLNGPEALTDYINAGLLLLDLDLIREEGLGALMFAAAHRETDYAYADQDVINAALNARILRIDARWNVLMSVLLASPEELSQAPPRLKRDIEAQLQEAYIAHFVHLMRPQLTGRYMPYADEWLAVAKSSPAAAHFSRAIRWPRARRQGSALDAAWVIYKRWTKKKRKRRPRTLYAPASHP